tara:strand:+ start:838 stop:2028 length:1191 start_codon:yes stop_codon:yes gene_type:complete
MSILSAIKQQSGSIEDLAKLPQTMIMQMAQRKEIVPEMVPAILAKKADMIDRAAKAKAAQGGVPQQSIMDQIMAKNANAENPQTMGQMPPPMPQQNQMAQQPQPMQQPQGPEDVGIASNPVPPMQLAGGGIIAFAAGDQVKGNKQPIATDYQADIRAALDAQKDFNPTEKSDLMAQQYAQEMQDRKGQSNNLALANMAAGMLAGDSPYFFTNVGKGAQKGVESLASSNAQEQADRKLLLQNQIEGERFKEQRRVGGLNALIQAQAAVDAKKLGLEQIQATLAAARSTKEAALISSAATARQTFIRDRARDLMTDEIKKFKYNGNSNQALLDAAQEYDLTVPQAQLDLLGLTRPKPRLDNDFKPPAAEPEKTPWWMPAKPGKVDYELKDGKLVPVNK